MKILFLYRYGILGGVCTQLFHRLRHLPKSHNFEIHCGFRSDHGVKTMLEEYATLHFGLNKETTISFLEQNNFDIVIIIDTEEYIQAISAANVKCKVLIEVHTSIERNLDYLARINHEDIDGFVTVSDYMVNRIKFHISDELQNKPISIFTNVLDSNLFSNINVDGDGDHPLVDECKVWLKPCINGNITRQMVETFAVQRLGLPQHEQMKHTTSYSIENDAMYAKLVLTFANDCLQEYMFITH